MGVVGSVVLASAVAVTVAALAWRRATARRNATLIALASQHRLGDQSRFSRAATNGLPEPVARYFAFALPEGQPRIRVARVRWTGEMRLQPDAAWKPFTADQLFTAAPPGFVWDANFLMAPVAPVRVRDSYVAGEGQMLGRVAGVVPVVRGGGTAEMASSSLVRWLGEAAWLPTALLPGLGVSWEAVDDSTARATVTDASIRVSAEFNFAPNGEMTRMSAMRYRDVGGKSVLTPFEGRYEQYSRRDGLMLPSRAEVAWLLPEGRFAYWRGRPASVTYELARQP